VDENQYHRLLSNKTRRVILNSIADQSSVEFDELVRCVSKVLDEDEHTISVSLVHVHLPVMQESGVLDYNPQKQVIHVNELAVKRLDS